MVCDNRGLQMNGAAGARISEGIVQQLLQDLLEGIRRDSRERVVDLQIQIGGSFQRTRFFSGHRFDDLMNASLMLLQGRYLLPVGSQALEFRIQQAILNSSVQVCSRFMGLACEFDDFLRMQWLARVADQLRNVENPAQCHKQARR